MREIKFRGYNGEKWLFGNLDIDYKTKQAAISDDRWWRHPVRFKTVVIGNVYENPEMLEATE